MMQRRVSQAKHSLARYSFDAFATAGFQSERLTFDRVRLTLRLSHGLNDGTHLVAGRSAFGE